MLPQSNFVLHPIIIGFEKPSEIKHKTWSTWYSKTLVESTRIEEIKKDESGVYDNLLNKQDHKLG